MIQLKEQKIPATHIQKLIAQRMLASKTEKPCFYLEVKIDVTELLALRPVLRKSLKVKVTTNAFYIKALAIAAHSYPLVLGRMYGDLVKIAETIDVGFAVNAPHGLIVPVVKNADVLPLKEIAKMEKLLTNKARDNQLELDELTGQTVSLSNLGAYDMDSFFGIVPPSSTVIVSVGNIIPTVICENGDYRMRKMISMSLAVDHKVVNGAYAARFLISIKDLLENPEKLV